jgi:serine/threonine protein kinase
MNSRPLERTSDMLTDGNSTFPSTPFGLDPALPFQVGPYTVRSWIGRGGMARVYGGTYRGPYGFERPVAIKMARPGSESLQRLWREARLMAELCDDSVPVILDVGRTQGRPYYVMELVEGLTLYALLKAGIPIPFPVCLDLGMALCDVLSTLHTHTRDGLERSITHCDIKPANIMLTPSGTLKLLDFGIASVKGSPMIDNVSYGTARYMAPEQISGHGLDGRADIFSLGVLLFELVTAERMFRDNGPAGLLRDRLLIDDTLDRERVVAKLGGHCPGLPQVVLTCMKGNPEHRYPSVDALRTRLKTLRRRIRGGPGVHGWASTFFSGQTATGGRERLGIWRA